jgi:hypothetical protein
MARRFRDFSEALTNFIVKYIGFLKPLVGTGFLEPETQDIFR